MDGFYDRVVNNEAGPSLYGAHSSCWTYFERISFHCFCIIKANRAYVRVHDHLMSVVLRGREAVGVKVR